MLFRRFTSDYFPLPHAERRLSELVAARNGLVVSVTGPAGIGKSRMLCEWARARVAQTAGSVRYVRVEDGHARCWTRALLEGTIPCAVTRHEASEPVLVVDMGREPSTAMVAMLREVAETSSACRLVVATRHPLGISGEEVVELTPWSTKLTKGRSGTSPMGALIEARVAAMVLPAFPRCSLALGQLVPWTAGVPLLAELLAAAPSMGAEGIVERLSALHRQWAPTLGAGAPEESVTQYVSAFVSEVLAAIPGWERSALGLAACLPALPWSVLQDLYAAWSEGHVLADALALDHLVAVGWMQLDISLPEPTLVLANAVKCAALAQLPRDAVARAESLLLERARHLAEEFLLPGRSRTREWTQAEPVLQHAVLTDGEKRQGESDALERGSDIFPPDARAAAFVALDEIYSNGGNLERCAMANVAARWLDESGATLSATARAQLFWVLGRAHARFKHDALATRYLTSALRVADRTTDGWVFARASVELARLERNRGGCEQHRVLLDQARQAAVQSKDYDALALIEGEMGMVKLGAFEPEEARVHVLRARMLRALCQSPDRVGSDVYLAHIDRFIGHAVAAEERYRALLASTAAMPAGAIVRGIVNIGLSAIYAEAGQLDRADRHIQTALDDLMRPDGIPWLHEGYSECAAIAEQQGDAARAAKLHARLIDTLRLGGHMTVFSGMLALRLAAALARGGHLSTAQTWMERAMLALQASTREDVHLVADLHAWWVSPPAGNRQLSSARSLLRRAQSCTTAPPGLWDGIALIRRWIMESQAAGAEHQHPLRMSRDGAWVMLPDGVELSLLRKPVLRRLMCALASHHDRRPGQPLAAEQLVELLWPGETGNWPMLLQRLYMSIRNLRKLGLEDIIINDGTGYLLAPSLTICQGPVQSAPLVK